MSPRAALMLVTRITSESPAERDDWSGAAGAGWSGTPLDEVERTALAAVHGYAAAIETDPATREKLLASTRSLSVGGRNLMPEAAPPGGARTAVGPQRCVDLIRGLCSSPSPMGWCRILDEWIAAGELEGDEIAAAAAVVAWAAIVEDGDPLVRATRLATLLHLGRQGLLPSGVREQVVAGISPLDLEEPGADHLRAIDALPPAAP
jgi:hypothetical protein